MNNNKKWIFLFVVIDLFVVFPLVVFFVLSTIPVTADPIVPPEQIIVGAPVQASGTGLVMNFPPIAELKDNPTSPAKQTLGRLLFFDPILSADHAMACATCHTPDLGLGDGRPTGQGSAGQPLVRNVPSLYEVAYKSHLFWDGRAANLESQASTPLTAKDEMANTSDKVVADLKAIREYQDAFATAFPGQSEPITLQNIGYALASFERSVTAHHSPFDRYAAGDLAALTPSQRRGFALFKSGATGCYHCHAVPTFNESKPDITGVPDADGKLSADMGWGAITHKPEEAHAFSVPSLRNVALTAPYMHNGVFKTLDDVIAFYAKGGGKGMGLDVPNQSRFVRPFSLNDQERADLVNFLIALTDESDKPLIPDKVPSGLAVITAQDNPARAVVERTNTGSVAVTSRPPATLSVSPDVTIQSVVDKAQPGDTIEIQPGTYHERILVDQNDITLRGIPDAVGNYPTLDGQMKFTDGISASGNHFTAEQLHIMNYAGNGIIVDGANGVTIRDIFVENTSLYGIYPVHATNVLVERVKATKIRDAGVYCGQCRDTILRDNEAYGNVIGIEIENSVNSELYNNHVYNNSTGLFVDLLPTLPSKVSLNTNVHDNIVENNNLPNFANEGEIGALVPEGTGILVLGGDDVQVHKNIVRDNRTGGVGVFSTAVGFKPEELDIGPNPERVHVYDNTYAHNGYQPAKKLTDLGITSGADIIWDVSNWDNRFDDPSASMFPPILPNSSWSDMTRRSYWQAVHFIISKMF